MLEVDFIPISMPIWIRYWNLYNTDFNTDLKSVFEIGMKSVLYRFQYRIQIGTEIGINSVYTDFRIGIGAKSVRYRYTEPINQYTDSRYTVSSLVIVLSCYGH